MNTSPVALTDTMYQALNLVANTTYNWRVRVKCNGVWQSWPGYQASFTTPDGKSCESTGHVVDAFVDASKRGTITADFSWDKMSIGEEYQINYRGDGVNTSPVALTDTMYQALNLERTLPIMAIVDGNGVWQSWPGYLQSRHLTERAVDGSSGGCLCRCIKWRQITGRLY